MNLENCFICHRPVIEFAGQFEKLDPYMLTNKDEAYRQGAYGWCHSACLSHSGWGRQWNQMRIRHWTEVMGYVKVAENDALTGLLNPRSGQLIFLASDGVSYSVSASDLDHNKKGSSGMMIPVTEEMNFEFDDDELAEKIKETLLETTEFSLIQMVDELGLSNTLLYPDAIEDGFLKLSDDLIQDWSENWVSAIAHYKQFIPASVIELAAEIRIW